jgi:hypothetical protein
VTVFGAEVGTGLCKPGCEAAAVVSQHMGEPKRPGRRGFLQERQRAAGGYVVLDGQMCTQREQRSMATKR